MQTARCYGKELQSCFDFTFLSASCTQSAVYLSVIFLHAWLQMTSEAAVTAQGTPTSMSSSLQGETQHLKENKFHNFPVPVKTELPILSCSDDSGYDDSLTDIRWLGSMDAGMNFPAIDNYDRRFRLSSRDAKSRGKAGICKKLSYEKEEKSEAHKIRPPFSYAALISLAINSHPQKMLTLNSIYRWIEAHFPFFRMPEAKAWKVSLFFAATSPTLQ